MDFAKDMTLIIPGCIAIASLILGLVEYKRQGATKRAEHFITMRQRLKESESFKAIGGLIENDNEKLREITFESKRDYLGLFEEVALSMNSRLINKKVAHYMFGYYAIRCWESENFWNNINRNSPYWFVFRDFVSQMKEIEADFKYHRCNYKF